MTHYVILDIDIALDSDGYAEISRWGGMLGLDGN
jgi:hypothetical protein